MNPASRVAGDFAASRAALRFKIALNLSVSLTATTAACVCSLSLGIGRLWRRCGTGHVWCALSLVPCSLHNRCGRGNGVSDGVVGKRRVTT